MPGLSTAFGAAAPKAGGGPLPDRKIYELLKKCLDTPRVLFATEEPLLLQRHSALKRVVVVATKHYTYLIKQKGCKLYHRWLNRELIVEARGERVHLTCTAAPVTAAIGGGSDGVDEDDFRSVMLEADSIPEAASMEDRLNILVHNAQRTAALLEIEEAGGANSRLAALVAGLDEDDLDASDSSASDDGDDELLSGAAVAATAGAGADGGRKAAAGAGDGTQGLLHIAPSRYIAITSLVDGEFADYTTLKNAYMRNEEEDLLKDLATFIKENEGQVETLCGHHYPAFIHAAQQCLAISERDAQLVGEELSGASTLVRAAVLDLKQAAASLIVSRSTRENLAQARLLLGRAVAVVEYLETAEAQVQKQQLVGALASLKELVRLSTSLAEYSLGEYVLQVRVPALTQTVFSHAVQHTNAWLRLLRDSANPIGRAAIQWEGRVAMGRMVKHINNAQAESSWWLSETFSTASLRLAPYEQAEALTAVCNGAAIQGVFKELRREEFFARYYAEGRAQQVKADIFDAPLPVADVPGPKVVANFENFCATVLGFILIEDAVYHATSPHLQSRPEILKRWDRVAATVTTHARAVGDALAADPEYAAFMASMFATLRNLVQHATENVKSVELSALALSRVVEALSDNVVSWALQGACLECTQMILTDPFNPLTVNTAEQFSANVSRFFLNLCPELELPVPAAYTTGTVTLPYSSIVPAIGEQVLHFLDRCYAVVATDMTSAVRQSELNNVDEMLLKYISVLFRTVAESLSAQLMMIPPRSVVQFATFVSSSSALPIIVSCVEQRFMLNWAGGDGGSERQVLGHPRLLAPCAAFFAKPVRQGIEGLLKAYMEEITDRLKPLSHFSYWKRQIDIRSGRQQRRAGDGAEEGMADSMDYAIHLIPKLTSILQRTVACSVVGTAIANASVVMHEGITTALEAAYKDGERDFPLMRQAVKEYELQCTLLIPTWQRQLGEVLKELGAAQRFPLNVSSVVEDATGWLDRREAQYMAERANQPQLLAGFEMTGKAMAKGFRAVGDAAAATANVFKRE